MNKRRLCARVLSGAVCALTATAVVANPWIDMGVKDDFAFDQPQVIVELFANDGSGTSLGPSSGEFALTNRFLLDTGATSTIAMNDAETELRDNGYVTVSTVLEQGVAGFSELDVSDLYILEITGSDGSTVSLPNSRIMSGQFPDLFGINGLVGMTGMVGSVVSLDETVWEGIETLDDLFDADPLGVSFSSVLPTSNGHRFSVPIRAKRFDVIGEEELPSSAPIPLMDMSVGFGSLNAAGTFAVDTGAAISFISSEIAIQIGLDSNMDGVLGAGDDQFEDTLPIGGIGGTIEAPVFLIDRFTVPTEQGVDLVWNSPDSLLSVLVVDIHPDIDGILGSDLLTSGWIDLEAILLGEGDAMPGPIEQVHFDFRQFVEEDDTGTMYFDLTPSFDVVQPGGLLGDFNDDGTVDAADYVAWRKSGGSPEDYIAWTKNFGTPSSAAGLAGDFNADGIVDAADYVVWRKNGGNQQDYMAWMNNFGESLLGSGATDNANAGVPEPGGFILVALAACGSALTRKRLTLAARCATSTTC